MRDGTVIQWTDLGKYTYVAIVAGGRVYTTSNNDYVPKVLEVSPFIQWLNTQKQVSNVKVATQWQDVAKS